MKSLVFRGYPPIHCCCDTTWRKLPNGEDAVFLMTGGAFEPEPGNFVAMSRSKDNGEVWSDLEIIHRTEECKRDLFEKVPHFFDPNWRDRCVAGIATTMSEVVVADGIITVYMQNHDGHFGNWRTVTSTSADSGLTWSEPELFTPLPYRSMIRNLYRTTWGEYLLPYQYYAPTGEREVSTFADGSMKTPLNGVLISSQPHGPWEQGGSLPGPSGWAEVNVVEVGNEKLVMLSRTDNGYLMRTESTDRGRSWSPFVQTDIPNPASKFRLFRLKDGRILLLHNPNSQTSHPNGKMRCRVERNPLSLWISNDGMETWGYKEVLCDFPGMLSYPDGEVSADETRLDFAFDYNRHDAIYVRVAIPAA